MVGPPGRNPLRLSDASVARIPRRPACDGDRQALRRLHWLRERHYAAVPKRIAHRTKNDKTANHCQDRDDDATYRLRDQPNCRRLPPEAALVRSFLR